MEPFDLKKYLASAHGDRTITAYKKGEEIFTTAEDCNAVYFVIEGQVQVTGISEYGKEATVVQKGEGEFFGESSLTRQPKRLGTVIAATDSRVMRLPVATIRRLLDCARGNANPGFHELAIDTTSFGK